MMDHTCFLNGMKSSCQLDHQVDINLYVKEVTALHYSSETTLSMIFSVPNSKYLAQD